MYCCFLESLIGKKIERPTFMYQYRMSIQNTSCKLNSSKAYLCTPRIAKISQEERRTTSGEVRPSCTFKNKILIFLIWLLSAPNWPKLLTKNKKALKMRFYIQIRHTSTEIKIDFKISLLKNAWLLYWLFSHCLICLYY